MTKVFSLPTIKRGGWLPPLFIFVLIFSANFLGIAHAQNTADSYKLGVGDYIRIQVHGESDLTVEARLDKQGKISYPFIGDISVVGIEVRRLAQIIDEGLRGDYLLEPDVQVNVLEYRDFYINGAVTLPGGYPYVPGLTVRKATALAGGLTDLASPSKIYLIPEANPEVRQKVTLDYSVGPGDIVVVEEGLF